MSEIVSKRVVDQRLRNRIIEEVSSLAENDDIAMEWGASEYFEAFFDLMDMKNEVPWQNSCLSEGEGQSLKTFCGLMIMASDATPDSLTTEQLIKSGWPDRIRPEAQKVLMTFLERGRFGEDEEEGEPSFEAGRKWYEAVKEKAS